MGVRLPLRLPARAWLCLGAVVSPRPTPAEVESGHVLQPPSPGLPWALPTRVGRQEGTGHPGPGSGRSPPKIALSSSVQGSGPRLRRKTFISKVDGHLEAPAATCSRSGHGQVSQGAGGTIWPPSPCTPVPFTG